MPQPVTLADDCAAPAKKCRDGKGVGCSAACVANEDTPCPHSCPATPCAKDKMTPEYCLEYCAAMGYRYMGLESGSQCFCDHEIRNKKAAGDDPKVKTACSKICKIGFNGLTWVISGLLGLIWSVPGLLVLI